MFFLYFSGLLYFSEDNNSHQIFSSAAVSVAARLTDKQEGFLKQLMLQASLSETVNVSSLGTFR